MQKLKLVVVTLFIGLTAFSQAIETTMYSNAMEEERELKILLPRGYSNEDKKAYPVIYVLDGDYLFEVVSGNVDFYSYWEDIPDAIVVGVIQSEERDDDLAYSGQNSLPVDGGADFFKFVGSELTKHIEKTYKTEPFRVIVGHGKTANFVNYFLVREAPVFNAYISISPDFAKDMPNYIIKRMETLEQKIFYYMATSTNDVPFIMEETNALNTRINTIENTNLFYTFNEINGANHYTTPAHAIPRALDRIFFTFQPISKKEYKESILNLKTSPVEYLIQKYEEINTLFGIEKQILINDFKAIAAAIKKKQQWDYYQDLAKLARKQYPDTVLHNYYLGQYYERVGETKKAMKIYKDAYILEEIGGITKNHLLDLADDIKAEFEN
ncbi:MAG: alpha/beta hydrolase [Winogradskyella sp.]